MMGVQVGLVGGHQDPPGSFMYLLTTPTACAISGLVQTIAHIKLPTTDAYGTLDI